MIKIKNLQTGSIKNFGSDLELAFNYVELNYNNKTAKIFMEKNKFREYTIKDRFKEHSKSFINKYKE